jgi:biotin-dependent carboxylase-like uncharacterized protein
MLKVHNPGLFTSIQDGGRYHFRHYGVPVSGALDQEAMMRANALLENDTDAAVLEITMKGPELEFTEPTYIVLSGAPLEAKLNDEPMQMDRIYEIASGTVLSCGHVLEGLRTYLGIRGGFLSEKVLGSRSQYFPVTKERGLTRGMAVPYEGETGFQPKLLEISTPGHYRDKELQVFKAPEFDRLTDEQLEQLFKSEFRLAKEHDRMACQLEPAIAGHSIDMITSATLPGTVQLTPSGRLLVLMRDGQTTGGYPRILQLDERSLDLMAQKRFGDVVSFRLV